MIRIGMFGCLIAVLLAGCSKKDAPNPAPMATSTPTPFQLTITNQPIPAPAPAVETPKIEKGFAVKNGGNLYLTFPRAWQDKITQVTNAGRRLDYIVFRPGAGEEFRLAVGVNYIGETNAAQRDIKAILEDDGQMQLPDSVEKSLVIHDLQGPQMTGCYFVLTDKKRTIAAPKAGQYLYLTQGYAKIGGLELGFSLFSNHLTPAQDEMLEMIKSARFIKK